MGWMFDNVERLIARLQKPANHREPLISDDAARALRDTLRPGDVLLVEGKGRFPAASNISLNRPGRIRRCTSGR